LRDFGNPEFVARIGAERVVRHQGRGNLSGKIVIHAAFPVNVG
jgi:hypothetical protein